GKLGNAKSLSFGPIDSIQNSEKMENFPHMRKSQECFLKKPAGMWNRFTADSCHQWNTVAAKWATPFQCLMFLERLLIAPVSVLRGRSITNCPAARFRDIPIGISLRR